MNDLSISTYRTIEALQVAVDNKVEVIESFACSKTDRTQRLWLIALAIAQEGPDILIRSIFNSPAGQVAVVARLVNCVDRAESHGNGRELPELWHQTRMRIRRKSATGMGKFLAEAIHLMFGQSSFNKCAGVHSWAGMSLEENLISATGMFLATEEVVEPNLIERGR